MTKLCGMMSVFSNTNSTGLPACTTIRSLSKSIWSVSVPTRTTRPPPHPLRRRTPDGEPGLLLRGRVLHPLEHRPPVGFEHPHGEVVQPAAEGAVGPVVDDDLLDRYLAAEVHLPPRVVGALLRVGLAAVAVVAAGVTVDAAGGDPAV